MTYIKELAALTAAEMDDIYLRNVPAIVLEQYAARLIAARVPLTAARTRIQQARVALDQATAVNHHIPKPTDAPQSAVSIAGIYAARRSTH